MLLFKYSSKVSNKLQKKEINSQMQVITDECKYAGGAFGGVKVMMDSTDHLYFSHKPCGERLELKVEKEIIDSGILGKWEKHWFTVKCVKCKTGWCRWRKHCGPETIKGKLVKPLERSNPKISELEKSQDTLEDLNDF